MHRELEKDKCRKTFNINDGLCVEMTKQSSPSPSKNVTNYTKKYYSLLISYILI